MSQYISQESTSSVEADGGINMSHSLAVDCVTGQGDNPWDGVLEEGGLIRAIRKVEGSDASFAVNEMLGYQHVSLSPSRYQRQEGAAPLNLA